MTPWREGWRTRGPGRPETSGRDEGRAVLDAVRDGVVPVIHGDVVEDVAQGTSVLSADTIVEMCAKWAMEEWPDECPRVVFCSDVFGVYDSPPTTRIINADVTDGDVPLRVNETETAVLLRDIIVDADADASASPGNASAIARVGVGVDDDVAFPGDALARRRSRVSPKPPTPPPSTPRSPSTTPSPTSPAVFAPSSPPRSPSPRIFPQALPACSSLGRARLPPNRRASPITPSTPSSPSTRAARPTMRH